MSEVAATVHALAVAEQFAPGRRPPRVESLGSGHIHDTLRARYEDASGDLVLQRLNEYVFPEIDAVMDNLVLVTRQLRRAAASPRHALELVAVADGATVVRDAGGAAWRAFRFIDDTRSYDVAPNDAVARAAAVAFGRFAAALAELDPAGLAVPIPGFHDLPVRLEQLRSAAVEDEFRRLAGVRAEYDGILEVGQVVASALGEGGVAGLPRHVVHNDCKLNNLLFDVATGEPICVVDLDTVMPGLFLVDFGELVRTAGAGVREGEASPVNVEVSVPRLEVLADGYVAGLGDALSDAERALMWLGPPWMAIENAARFLADYLRGDPYFRSGDNRARARVQLELARQLWGASGVLRRALGSAA